MIVGIEAEENEAEPEPAKLAAFSRSIETSMPGRVVVEEQYAVDMFLAKLLDCDEQVLLVRIPACSAMLAIVTSMVDCLVPYLLKTLRDAFFILCSNDFAKDFRSAQVVTDGVLARFKNVPQHNEGGWVV